MCQNSASFNLLNGCKQKLVPQFFFIINNFLIFFIEEQYTNMKIRILVSDILGAHVSWILEAIRSHFSNGTCTTTFRWETTDRY